MSSDQDNTQESSLLNQISGILDSYLRWYGQLMQGSKMIDDPGHFFKSFLNSLDKDVFITQRRIDHVLKLQGQVLDEKSNNKALPKIFEKFYSELRRLERDALLEDSGLDFITGLKSGKILIKDIDRQLQRLAREGQSFCLALVAIDSYDESMESYGVSGEYDYTKTVSELIKKSIRSFDEAYRSGSGEFVLMLKQSDISGGIAALERLRKFLEYEKMMIKTTSGEVLLSLSSVVTEPVPQDNPADLIENMRRDLSRQMNKSTDLEDGEGDQKSNVLKYHEVSPLERYVQENFSSS